VKIIKKILLGLIFSATIVGNLWAGNTNLHFSAKPVSKNVYSIISSSYGLPTPENKGWNSNSYFVVTDSGVLVFDTGSSELIGHEIKRVIKSVTNKPVRWLVNSHSHADHWLGNAAFIDAKSDIQLEIISTKAALATMTTDGQPSADFFFKVTKGATGKTHLKYPTSLVNQNEKRNLGGVDVEFIFSNDGHSPGDIMMWLPEQKIIFGGDVVNSDWMPILIDHGNVSHLIDSLYSVIKLQPSIVLPGHGGSTNVQSVIRDAELLSQVTKLVEEGKVSGKSQEAVLLSVSRQLAPKYSALYKNFDAGIKQQIPTLYK